MSKVTQISNGCYGPFHSREHRDFACRNRFGPEWRYSGEGTNRGCPAFEHKIYCIHDSYHGEPYPCCTTGESGKDQITCDPKYTPSSALCNDSMTKFCKGDKLFKNPRCRQWAEAQPGAAYVNVKEFCTNPANIDQEFCKIWCNRQKDGTCDSAVTEFCKKNKNHPYCSCINSKLAGRDYNINPKCFDADCLKTGYLTKTMDQTPCPNIVDCAMNIKLANSGVNLANFQYNQNCSSSTGGGTVNTGSGSSPSPGVTISPGGTTSPGGANVDSSEQPTTAQVFVGFLNQLALQLGIEVNVLFVLLMILLTVIIYRVLILLSGGRGAPQ